MKLQVFCFVLLFLVSFSTAQDYSCISGTVCVPDRLRSLAEQARANLTDAVARRLADLIVRLNATQDGVRTVVESNEFRDMLAEELSGEITEFHEGSRDFIRDLVQHLVRDAASIRDAISTYTRNISFSYVEMIFQRIEGSDTFQSIISSIREAKQCFLENLYERGFMNTTNAVSEVIDRSRETIDRIAVLTRTALTDLAPVRAKISDIVSNFVPISSCLEVFSTSLGCRLCQFPDNQIALQASPCLEFCGQTVTYCLSVVRGALPGVSDVIRVIKLISEALKGDAIQDRFRDTLLSFGELVAALEQLGENVFNFLKEFDLVDFIRDVANECFPGIVDALNNLYDAFKTAVRNVLGALRDAIQGAIDRVKEGVDNITNVISGLFGRRRRQIASDELLLDQVLQLVVDDFCKDLPSGTGDQCWNGTAIAAYNPEVTVDFSVAAQADNPAVMYAGVSSSVAVDAASAEVSALNAASSSSSSAICDSLIVSGNSSLYNDLSTTDEGCYEELNSSRAILLTNSVFVLLSILAMYCLYLF